MSNHDPFRAEWEARQQEFRPKLIFKWYESPFSATKDMVSNWSLKDSTGVDMADNKSQYYIVMDGASHFSPISRLFG